MRYKALQTDEVAVSHLLQKTQKLATTTSSLNSGVTLARHPPKRTQDSKEGRGRAAFGGSPLQLAPSIEQAG